ncbi:MAG: ferredoxin [Actinobacteria bacterium]|jgi:ferredoxin|nr:ferredoxin [Actinomycetota bacterium]MCO5300166.1 ferredoxin [Candidatus Nanopelagicales bacterium]MCB9429316.1 ferredoxin [Actinomycetota bacterium]HPE11117.1 ferredoxin [Actinomycetota bacterium]HPJ18044.1 ferredoxin [Actinomycetota bacterium]
MSTIQIDWRRCRGHGVCSAALEGVITLDEWGFPILSSHDLPDKQHGAARIAQWTCPAAALRVTR